MDLSENAAAPEELFSTFNAFLADKKFYEDLNSVQYREYILGENELKVANKIFEAHGLQPTDELALTWEQETSSTNSQGEVFPTSNILDIKTTLGNLSVIYSLTKPGSSMLSAQKMYVPEEIYHQNSGQEHRWLAMSEAGDPNYISPHHLEALVGMKLIERDELFALASLATYLIKK